MEMKFSAKFMKITFEPGEMFDGLSVRMKGEPLSNGFDASLDSMEWIENHQTHPADNYVKQKIRELIEVDNLNHPFKVVFMEE